MVGRANLPLLGFELAALTILALGVLPIPDTIPIALPLALLAAVARGVRGRPLISPPVDRTRVPFLVGAGVATGAVALGLAVAIGAPLAGPLDWSTYPVARGSATMATLAVVAAATAAFALELALRGWVLERARELGASGPLAIAVACVVEAAVTPGSVAVRIGAALVGAALGYLALAGGALAPAIAARVTFAIGAVAVSAFL